MVNYLIKRLLLMIPTVLGAVTLVFIVIRLTPGDPAEVLLGDYATPASVAQLQDQFGLNEPIATQYLVFLRNAATLDFGYSYLSNRPVMDQIRVVLPYSFHLALGAMFVALAVGIPTGVLAAISQSRGVDGASMVGALTLVSVPNFFLGVLLIYLFSIQFGLLPVTGAGDPSNPLSLIKHLILPSIALGGGSAAILARMTRSSLSEVMSKEYIVTARAKGVNHRGVVIRHALKNALLLVVAVAGLQVGRLLGGSVIIETVFARPGLGKLVVDSITGRDYMQVQAALIVIAVIFVFVNLLTDITYGVLDPRIRYD